MSPYNSSQVKINYGNVDCYIYVHNYTTQYTLACLTKSASVTAHRIEIAKIYAFGHLNIAILKGGHAVQCFAHL